MNPNDDRHAEEPGGRPKLGRFIFWTWLLLMVYLFSSGPVTRWFPGAADRIYAPLTPLVRTSTFGPALRWWVSLWGVNFK